MGDTAKEQPEHLGAWSAVLETIREFFAWWGRQVRSLAPWRATEGALVDGMIVEIGRWDRAAADPLTAGGRLLLRRAGAETVAAPLDLSRPAAPGLAGDLPIGLRLPASMVLHREVTLPAAALRNLPAVLGFEMDRLTPFSAAELFWSVSALARGPQRATLTLDIVPRHLVQPVLDALGGIGLVPSFVESGPTRIELAGAARGGPGRLTWLIRICMALAFACLAVPVVHQQVELGTVRHRLAALAPAERDIIALRGRLGGLGADQAAVAAAEPHGDALAILTAVTNALPDGTWLTDFTQSPNGVVLDGESANAAALLASLAAAPGLRNPSFIAPVTRAPDGRTDMFSIQVAFPP